MVGGVNLGRPGHQKEREIGVVHPRTPISLRDKKNSSILHTTYERHGHAHKAGGTRAPQLPAALFMSSMVSWGIVRAPVSLICAGDSNRGHTSP